MSGGIGYVWDRQGDFNIQCNLATVELEQVSSAEEQAELRELIQQHLTLTGSQRAADALENWPEFLKQCVKVMPTDYKRVLMEMAAEASPPISTNETPAGQPI